QYNLTERYYTNRLINRICKRVILTFWRDQRHARIPQLPFWKGVALISKWLNPQVELDDIDAQLSSLANEFLSSYPPSSEDGTLTMDQQCRRLVHFFVHDLHFLGNAENYYDIKNSLIDQVISRRLGIPISLSIVFQSIAQRAGISTVELIGTPGHLLLRFRDTTNLRPPPPLPATASITDDDGYLYIDLFDPNNHFFTKGGAVAHLRARFEARQFESVILEHSHFNPMQFTDVYLRSLRNIFTTVDRSPTHSLRPSPASEAQKNAVLYAVTSQMLALDPVGQHWAIRKRCLYLLQQYWPEDVAFAEEWHEDAPDVLWDHIDAINTDIAIKEERREDERGVVTEIKRRKFLPEGEVSASLDDKLEKDGRKNGGEGESEVKVRRGVEQIPAWRVGTVFKHKREGYIAVIYGWDLGKYWT
ncbi:Transglutaminase-like superfamily-domain-containing protein, partial [Endogone sp. FLAS-F59071]